MQRVHGHISVNTLFLINFILPQELHDFSGMMAVFAIESPFWRIATEKVSYFSVTMINDRPQGRFFVTISQQCFSNDAGVLKNKSIYL